MPTAILPDPAVTVLQNNSEDGWPVVVDMKVIEPGLVHYEDLNDGRGANVLVAKETLDRMAASLEGRPIINWDHRKVDPKDFKNGKAQGIITGPAFFNAADGWYHAKGLIWDPATIKNIENGYSISCAYTVSEWGDGPGNRNLVPFQNEVRNGAYTHIAVVRVPRYNGARIELLNSQGGSVMGLLSFFRKDKPEEKMEFDPATAQVAVGDKDVPLQELINSYAAEQDRKAKAPVKLGPTDLVDINGVKVPVSELINARDAVLANALADEHEKGEHKDEPKENCASCKNARKNAADDEEKKKKDEDDERKNSLAKEAAAKEAQEKAEAAQRAQTLENARRTKDKSVEMPEMKSVSEMVAEGSNRYGTGK